MQTTAQRAQLSKLKIGDVVVLASGGPPMKVIGVSPNGRIWCQWEQGDGSIDEASFAPEMLLVSDRD